MSQVQSTDGLSPEGEEISYRQAKEELDTLLERLDSSDVGIDELRGLVERARFLVQTCRQMIRRVEGEIDVLLSEDTP